MRFFAPSTKLVVLDRLVSLLCFPAHGQGPQNSKNSDPLHEKRIRASADDQKDAPMPEPPGKNRSPNGCIWSKKLIGARLMQTFRDSGQTDMRGETVPDQAWSPSFTQVIIRRGSHPIFLLFLGKSYTKRKKFAPYLPSPQLVNTIIETRHIWTCGTNLALCCTN
jgi:hypothetical protein